MIEIVVSLLSLFLKLFSLRFMEPIPKYIYKYIFPSTDAGILFKLYCVFIAHCLLFTRAKGNCTFLIFGYIMPLIPLSALKST